MSKKISKIKSDYSADARLKRWMFLLIPTKLSVFLFRKVVDKNRERNSIEAALFLADTNNIYATRFYFLLGKFLRFSLALGDVNLPKSYVSEIIKSLQETRRRPSKRKGACEQILSATSKLSPQQTSAHGWKLVSLALSGLGFIRAGTIARNYCLTAALSQVSSGNATHRTINLATKGLLESRRFDEARHLIESQASSTETRDSDETYSDYLALLNERRPEAGIQDLAVESDIERLFSNLVTRKSVALVASGVVDKEYGQEIDSHDTVFRVKFIGRSALPDENYTGRRLDITSHDSDILAIAKFDENMLKRLTSEAADLKIIVSKRYHAPEISSIPVKQMLSWPPTFLTTGTSGTLALFEILRYSPKRVKLFCFDFYSKRQQYNTEILGYYQTKDYLRAKSLPLNEFNYKCGRFGSAKIALAFIAHDLKSDFLLVKNLYELSGLIDGTPEVLEILNLTADEYDARLEEMLGDW